MEICSKKTYDSHKQAKMNAEAINGINAYEGKASRVRPYKCHKCGLFHLTSKTKGEEVDQEKRIRREAEHWVQRLK